MYHLRKNHTKYDYHPGVSINCFPTVEFILDDKFGLRIVRSGKEPFTFLNNEH